MTLTLPDSSVAARMTPEELKIELACALFSRGKIGKIAGAELAGIDFFAFQKALGDREISTQTLESLEQEIDSLNRLFPTNPIPKPKA